MLLRASALSFGPPVGTRYRSVFVRADLDEDGFVEPMEAWRTWDVR